MKWKICAVVGLVWLARLTPIQGQGGTDIFSSVHLLRICASATVHAMVRVDPFIAKRTAREGSVTSDYQRKNY